MSQGVRNVDPMRERCAQRKHRRGRPVSRQCDFTGGYKYTERAERAKRALSELSERVHGAGESGTMACFAFASGMSSSQECPVGPLFHNR